MEGGRRSEAEQREVEAGNLLSDAVLKRTENPEEATLDVAMAQVSALLALSSRLRDLGDAKRG
jgi:hypothetical protein